MSEDQAPTTEPVKREKSNRASKAGPKEVPQTPTPKNGKTARKTASGFTVVG